MCKVPDKMGDLFSEYETQFINLLSRIRQGKEGGLEEQAEELLEKMSLEARTSPSPAREERKEVVNTAQPSSALPCLRPCGMLLNTWHVATGEAAPQEVERYRGRLESQAQPC